MHSAMMRYFFREDRYDEACELWRKTILEPARKAPGMVVIQFYTARPNALAIGCWESEESARDFMATGVFAKFTELSEGMMERKPIAERWKLDSYAQGV
jgi:pentatricopeptide repeat protein